MAMFGVDEVSYSFAGLFVTFCCFGCEIVSAAVNVAIERCVVSIQCVDDTLGFLCCGGIVEIYKRFAVNVLVEYRKKCSDVHVCILF